MMSSRRIYTACFGTNACVCAVGVYIWSFSYIQIQIKIQGGEAFGIRLIYERLSNMSNPK